MRKVPPGIQTMPGKGGSPGCRTGPAASGGKTFRPAIECHLVSESPTRTELVGCERNICGSVFRSPKKINRMTRGTRQNHRRPRSVFRGRSVESLERQCRKKKV